MDNTTGTKIPTTASNIYLKGREFIVSGPVELSSFRYWILTGPNGALYTVTQHNGAKWQRSILAVQTSAYRDLYIKGNRALVEVQSDGTLEAA